VGAFLKEKQKDGQRRARARRRHELVNEDLLGTPPKLRGPSVRMRCASEPDVGLGERVAIRLDKNIGAVVKAGKIVGVVLNVPDSVQKSAGGSQTIEATVSRKHTVGFGVDIQFDGPRGKNK
jgi:hypothetical protein